MLERDPEIEKEYIFLKSLLNCIIISISIVIILLIIVFTSCAQKKKCEAYGNNKTYKTK